MIKIEGQAEDTYWILRNDTLIHYGLAYMGDIVESDLTILEIFVTKVDWIYRLNELGIEIIEEETPGEETTGEAEEMEGL
jgi:hypothetical protein